jgi:hypothetical protein
VISSLQKESCFKNSPRDTRERYLFTGNKIDALGRIKTVRINGAITLGTARFFWRQPQRGKYCTCPLSQHHGPESDHPSVSGFPKRYFKEAVKNIDFDSQLSG